jgi:hypothetical protein
LSVAVRLNCRLALAFFIMRPQAAGGTGADNFTFCIIHRDGEQLVVDVLRGTSGKFDPAQVTEEYAALAREYGITTVVGEYYGAEWNVSAWRAQNLTYQRCEKNRSEVYLEVAPLFARHLVRVPEHAVLLRELRSLERRTHRSGKDSVEHPKGGHDDYANVVSVALLLAREAAATIWARQALTPAAPLALTTVRGVDLIFGVLAVGKAGAGVVFFAAGRVRQMKHEPLLIVDALAEPLSATFFEAIAHKLSSLQIALRAQHSRLFAPRALVGEVQRHGIEVEISSDVFNVFAADPDIVRLAAEPFVRVGRVKAIDPQLANRVLGGAVDDALKVATEIGIVIALDETGIRRAAA